MWRALGLDKIALIDCKTSTEERAGGQSGTPVENILAMIKIVHGIT